MKSRFMAMLTASALLPLVACQPPEDAPLPPPDNSPNQPQGDPTVPQQPDNSPN